MIVVDKAEKLRKGAGGLREGEVCDCLDFARERLDALRGDIVSEEGDAGDPEDAFVWADDQTVILEALEDLSEMRDVIVSFETSNQNII